MGLILWADLNGYFKMKIEEAVKNLLQNHELVIIPGIGGLLAKRENSILYFHDNQIVPSFLKVSFNASLSENDGLLANYISIHSSISYTAAVKQINNFADEVFSLLNANQLVELNGIGNLKIGIENNLEFVPNNQNNLLLDSFGLRKVNAFQSVKEKLVYVPNEIHLESKKAKSKIFYLPKWNASTLKIAGSVILLAAFISMSIFFKDKISSPFNHANTASLADTSPNIKVVPEETLAIESVIQNDLPEVAEVVTETIVEEPVKQIAVAKSNVYIVCGAFSSISNVENLISKLNAKGFSASKLEPMPNGLIRVTAGSYNNSSQAESDLVRVRTEYPNAWILEL